MIIPVEAEIPKLKFRSFMCVKKVEHLLFLKDTNNMLWYIAILNTNKYHRIRIAWCRIDFVISLFIVLKNIVLIASHRTSILHRHLPISQVSRLIIFYSSCVRVYISGVIKCVTNFLTLSKTPHCDSVKNFVTHFVTPEIWILSCHLNIIHLLWDTQKVFNAFDFPIWSWARALTTSDCVSHSGWDCGQKTINHCK